MLSFLSSSLSLPPTAIPKAHKTFDYTKLHCSVTKEEKYYATKKHLLVRHQLSTPSRELDFTLHNAVPRMEIGQGGVNKNWERKNKKQPVVYHKQKRGNPVGRG